MKRIVETEQDLRELAKTIAKDAPKGVTILSSAFRDDPTIDDLLALVAGKDDAGIKTAFEKTSLNLYRFAANGTIMAKCCEDKCGADVGGGCGGKCGCDGKGCCGK